MLLSTAMPMVMAAIVIVIKSKGIDNMPIVPNIAKQAIKFGIIAASAILNDLNKIRSIKKIPSKTIESDLICESNKLLSILLYSTKIPATDTFDEPEEKLSLI